MSLLAACTPTPDTGDLVFACNGGSRFDSAISQATSRNEYDYTHVGIIERCGNNCFVIEAEPSRGVVRTQLDSFLQHNETVHYYRINEDIDLQGAVERAKSHLGEPYDNCFLPHNGSLYCSELVWEAFLTADGAHLFTARPMNFRSPDGTFSDYWTELFSHLGMSIPQDTLGTNPNDMAREKCLQRIGQ